jgi:hypothetical protein
MKATTEAIPEADGRRRSCKDALQGCSLATVIPINDVQPPSRSKEIQEAKGDTTGYCKLQVRSRSEEAIQEVKGKTAYKNILQSHTLAIANSINENQPPSRSEQLQEETADAAENVTTEERPQPKPIPTYQLLHRSEPLKPILEVIFNNQLDEAVVKTSTVNYSRPRFIKPSPPTQQWRKVESKRNLKQSANINLLNRKAPICFTCLQRGHARKYCQQQIKCFHCRKSGHKVSQCGNALHELYIKARQAISSIRNYLVFFKTLQWIMIFMLKG